MLYPFVKGAVIASEAAAAAAAPAQGGNLTLQLLQENAPSGVPGWALPLTASPVSSTSQPHPAR